jgi:hypothetical protein
MEDTEIRVWKGEGCTLEALIQGENVEQIHFHFRDKDISLSMLSGTLGWDKLMPYLQELTRILNQ